MIEEILNLFQQFKDRKKEDDIVMGAGDRELTGALAIAAAINKLADTLASFKPLVEAAVESYLSEQTYECGDEAFEVSTEDMDIVRRVLERAAKENEVVEKTDNEVITEHKESDDICRDCSNLEEDDCGDCVLGSKFMPRDSDGSE